MNDDSIRIGETLRAARRRAGIEVAELEARTHIRARYIHALEDESWDELPNDTYARAFLHTIAAELGLDAEVLADELRLQQGGRVGAAEDLITPQLGPERPPSRWLIAALAGGIVVLLLVFALTGGDDSDPGGSAGPRPPSNEPGQRDRARPRGKAALALAPLAASRVCVVSGGRTLVARQVLESGNRERFEPARRFVVDLEFGAIRLRTKSESTRLQADSSGDPITVVVHPGQIRRVPYSGDSCP